VDDIDKLNPIAGIEADDQDEAHVGSIAFVLTLDWFAQDNDAKSTKTSATYRAEHRS